MTGDEKTGRWWPTAVVAAAMIAAAAVVYVVFVRQPEWTDTTGAAQGRDAHGRPWIGSAHPTVVIHEYFDYACPHCLISHRRLRRMLAAHWDAVRLVRHDYARMACRPVGGLAPCPLARAAFCAARQRSYWKWNDAFVARVSPGEAGDAHVVDTVARALQLDKAALRRCASSEEAFSYAQQGTADAQTHRVRATPTYLVDGKPVSLADIAALLDSL